MPGKLISAMAISVPRTIPWSNATVSSDALPGIASASDPFDASVYAVRDSELAYRDLIVGAAASKLAMLANDLYGARFLRLVLPISAAGDLSISDVDFGYSTPGTVRHVQSGDAPLAALQTDRDLSERDALIYSLLYWVSTQVFSPIPLIALTRAPGALEDTWSLADGYTSRRTVSSGWILEPATFNSPDRSLAERDNWIAGWASILTDQLLNPLALASRVVVSAATSGQVSEPEVYNLYTTDGRVKVFKGWPLIPDRYDVEFDPRLKQIDWHGEGYVAAGARKPFAPRFVTSTGGYVEISKNLPAIADCEFYRQKSSRLDVREYRDVVSIRVDDVENYAISGSVYQLDGAVLAQSGNATFGVPAPIQAGCVRVGLLVQPARTFDVLGFQNTAGSSDGTAAYVPGSGQLTWSVPVPPGSYYLSATFSDPDAHTTAFPIRIYYNATLVFDGSWAYNLPAGTVTTTQSFEFVSSGGPAIIVIERLSADGALRLEKLSLTSKLPADLPVLYTLAAQIDKYSAPQVTLNGVLGRTESIFFDISLPTVVTAPLMTVSFFGAAGVALKVLSYDVRTYEGENSLPNAESYEGAKATLLRRATLAVQQAWPSSLSVDYATEDLALGRVLDYAAYLRWIAVLRVKQPRILQAFQVAGPGDVGRPAIIPAGLVASDLSVAMLTKPPIEGVPVLRVCQPWMVSFGVLVAGADFWPLPFRACESVAGAVIVSADFDFTVFDTDDDTPTVVGMSALSFGSTAPNNDSFSAYSILNVGRGGGYSRQYTNVTAYLSNLRIGAVYTITLNLRSTPVGGGASTLSTIEETATAAEPTDDLTFSTISASDGYITEVTGATIS